MTLKTLGISAFYHDSAAALVVDGRVVAASQEERFSRKKHDAGFPRRAIASCLALGGLRLREVDQVVFYDKPLLKFERLLETYLAFAPRGVRSFAEAMPLWLREKLLFRRHLGEELAAIDEAFPAEERLLFSEHHLSHAASAFFPSPFERAAVLTLDGVGEWATTTAAVGEGSSLRILKEIHFPHSLGLLYSAFTLYTGFRVNSGEYKVMGLAPYGTPRYAQRILEHLIDLRPDGSFRLDLGYFDYCVGLRMINERFCALFGGPARSPEAPLTQRDMDLAASIQAVTEEVVLRLTRSLADELALPDLCLAGGVALNCVASGKVLRDGRFRRLWVQPAAGDAGGALGAALAAQHLHARLPRSVPAGLDGMDGAFLGPEASPREIEDALRNEGVVAHHLAEQPLLERCAQGLARGLALGWFQGRMEFGPRALGARSILADPRSPRMQSVLNQKVKLRESFRPFAPSILREDLASWFELDVDSPYMLLVAPVHPSRRRPTPDRHPGPSGMELLGIHRSEIPAVTHVDFSARIQTVHRSTNPRYHGLLSCFKRETGCPVLVNTSFNVRGEPIVGSPRDALRCFLGTRIDALAIGDWYLERDEQPAALLARYQPALADD